ncbi:hypothetical protein HJD18_00510 [Thermoleophilia bacterium SCSIO 60948]|nr:hypothetical protein HJD18_00510 [Thermoleophilia bacterium SCSIO 60948]
MTHPRTALVLLALLGSLFAAPASASAGQLDPSFGGDGRVVRAGLSGADAIAVDQRGRTLALSDRPRPGRSTSELLVTRFSASGRLDRGFGRSGSVWIDATGRQDYAAGIAIGEAGRITVATDTGRSNRYDVCDGGEDWSVEVIRLRSSGRLDREFGSRGHQVLRDDPGLDFQSPTAVDVGPNGAVAVSGYGWYGNGSDCNRVAIAARLDGAGAPDEAFGGDGVVRLDELSTAVDVEFDSAGAMLLGAQPRTDGFGAARLLGDGGLDETFGAEGVALADGVGTADVSILGDGRIAVSGRAGEGSAVAVFDQGGELAAEFGEGGEVATPFGDGARLVPRGDGFVAAGTLSRPGTREDFAAVAFEGDGGVDESFGTDGLAQADLGAAADDEVLSAAPGQAGKTVIGGIVAGVNERMGLLRLRR